MHSRMMLEKIELDDGTKHGVLFDRLVHQAGYSYAATKRWRADGKVVVLFVVENGHGKKKKLGRLFAKDSNGTPYNLPFDGNATCKEIVERIEKASLRGYELCLALDDGESAHLSKNVDVVWPRGCSFYEMAIKLDFEERPKDA